MLFKRKTCEHCGNQYDVVLEDCPSCHQKDGNFKNLGLPKNVCWLSLWQQIAIFVVGFVYGGMLIYQLLVSLIVRPLVNDKDLYAYLVICITYVAIFLTCIALCIPNFKSFIKHFKMWDKYLYGIGYAITMVAVSMLCGIIAKYGFGGTTNTNQSKVETYLALNPFFSLIIMGVIGPICEEFTYRVGLYSIARRLNKYVAIGVSTIVFAFIHFNFTSSDIVNELINLPSYLAGGIIFGIAYEHKGPACSMTAHICYNLFSLIVVLLR